MNADLADFSVTLLSAGQGDCVLVQYGDPAAPGRVLVDGGPARCYSAIATKFAAIPADRRRIDHLVLTHVDADHIEGVLKLLNDADLALDVSEVWFNGYEQLPRGEAVDGDLGPAQGEILSALLTARGIPLNPAFNGGAVQRRRGEPLPRVPLSGGLTLTVLGPDDAALRSLRTVWERACREAGIAPGSTEDALELLAQRKRLSPMDSYLAQDDLASLAASAELSEDSSAANASSIVLLAEYEGRSVLLTGDSTPAVLTAGLERLLAERRQTVLDVDAVKLPHHGSRHNVTRGVLELIRSPTYLVSTDSKYFGHPDAAAIARVIAHRPGPCRLVFNYRTKVTDQWSDQGLKARYGYEAQYPTDETSGCVVAI